MEPVAVRGPLTTGAGGASRSVGFCVGMEAVSSKAGFTSGTMTDRKGRVEASCGWCTEREGRRSEKRAGEEFAPGPNRFEGSSLAKQPHHENTFPRHPAPPS